MSGFQISQTRLLAFPCSVHLGFPVAGNWETDKTSKATTRRAKYAILRSAHQVQTRLQPMFHQCITITARIYATTARCLPQAPKSIHLYSLFFREFGTTGLRCPIQTNISALPLMPSQISILRKRSIENEISIVIFSLRDRMKWICF